MHLAFLGAVTLMQRFGDQDPDVIVQLVSSEGLCLTSSFDAADTTKNDAVQFKAKAK